MMVAASALSEAMYYLAPSSRATWAETSGISGIDADNRRTPRRLCRLGLESPALSPADLRGDRPQPRLRVRMEDVPGVKTERTSFSCLARLDIAMIRPMANKDSQRSARPFFFFSVTLEEEGVMLMRRRQHPGQDVRPCRWLLNLMPPRSRPRRSSRGLIGATPIQVELTW